MQLTREQTRDLVRGEGSYELGLELHVEGDWDVDNKYQHMTNIYFQEGTDKYFALSYSRSGSPFTDWYYSYEDAGSELIEVKLVERQVITREWEAV